MEELILPVVYAFLGLLVAGIVALKPKLFWPLLIVIAVGTTGFMVQGYALVDEYLLASLLFGSLLAIAMGAVRLRQGQEDVWTQLHLWIFFAMILYMVVQSVRGLLLWEDLRLSRWILYYLMLGLLAFLISKRVFPIPSFRKIIFITSGTALITLILYFLHGFLTEKARGISRWDIQGVEWAGPAGALFLLSIALPSILFLLKESSRIRRWIAWFVIFLAFGTSYYYDSRAGLLLVVFFLILSPTLIGFRRTSTLILLFSVVAGVFFFSVNSMGVGETLANFYRGAWEGPLFLARIFSHSELDTATRDIDRILQFQAPLLAITQNPMAFLFGYGVHSHHFVLVPYMQTIFQEHGLSPWPGDVVRTTGFSALLVDTGVIGMLLLGMNFLLVICKILFQKRIEGRLIFLAILAVVFAWLFVSNIQDVVLFYFLVMPSGFLVQMAQAHQER